MYELISYFTAPIEYCLQKTNRSFSQIQVLKNLIGKLVHRNIPKSKCLDEKSRIIVSMTIIKSRVRYLDLRLNSLLNQKAKIKKIIVNYSTDIDVETIDNLVKKYKNLIDFRKVPDIGSHRKYLFLTKDERRHRVLLVDDDMMFDRFVVRDIINSMSKDTAAVGSLFGWEITMTGERLERRKDWQFKLFPTKGASLWYWSHNAYSLYPENFFCDDVLNIDYIKRHFKNRDTGIIGYDDAWLNYHRIKKNIKVYYARPYSKFLLPAEFLNIGLTLGNTCTGQNSEERVFESLMNKVSIKDWNEDT